MKSSQLTNTSEPVDVEVPSVNTSYLFTFWCGEDRGGVEKIEIP